MASSILSPGYLSDLNLDGATLNFPAGMLEWTTYTWRKFPNLGSMTMSGTANVYLQGTLTDEGTVDDLSEASINLQAGDMAPARSPHHRRDSDSGWTSLSISGKSIDNEGTIELGQGLYLDDHATTANTGTTDSRWMPIRLWGSSRPTAPE